MSQTKNEIEELFRSRLACGTFIDDEGLCRPPQICKSVYNGPNHPVAHAAIVTAKFAIDQTKTSVPWVIAPDAYSDVTNRSMRTPVHYAITREILAEAAKTGNWTELSVIFGFLRPLPSNTFIFNQRKDQLDVTTTYPFAIAELTNRMPDIVVCLGKTTVIQMGTINQTQYSPVTL